MDDILPGSELLGQWLDPARWVARLRGQNSPELTEARNRQAPAVILRSRSFRTGRSLSCRVSFCIPAGCGR